MLFIFTEVCKRLLNIIEALDPEGTRTGLYRGVCCLEESLALEELSKRSDKPMMKEKTLREARDILEKAKEGLDNFGPAASLCTVIRSVYVRVLDQLRQYKLIEITWSLHNCTLNDLQIYCVNYIVYPIEFWKGLLSFCYTSFNKDAKFLKTN